MTFRADKRHRVQESGKSTKNVLKLASRLQRFLSTGRISKQDLKAIDDHFSLMISELGVRALQLLEQLNEHISKSKGKETLESVLDDWKKWLSRTESSDSMGYSKIQITKIEDQSVLVEAAIDIDTDLSRMLISFNSFLASTLRKCSYEIPDTKEIATSADEIIEAYASREKTLFKIS